MQEKAQIFGIFKLLRLFNATGTAVGTGVGYALTLIYHEMMGSFSEALAAMITIFLVTSSGFIINDIRDLSIDRINQPHRPIASGIVSVRAAWLLYGAFTIAAMVLSLFQGPPMIAATFLMIALLVVYSLGLKKQFMAGHVIIACLGALILPYGGIAAGSLMPTILTFPVIFTAFLGREILKTIPDAEGDRAHGVANLVTRLGKVPALRIALANFVLAALLLPLIQYLLSYGLIVILITLLTVWPLTLYLSIKSKPHALKIPLRVSKVVFLVVAVLLLAGSLVR